METTGAGEIRRLGARETRVHLDALAAVLADCVDGGASVARRRVAPGRVVYRLARRAFTAAGHDTPVSRLPRVLRLAGLAALALLAVSAPAAAARKPAHGERSAITAAFRGYVAMPNSPAARDNRIVSLRVSSLDPRYAAARLESKSAGPSEMVFHRGSFGWFVVEFGSSLGCDAAPAAVLRDLGIGCTPPDGVAWIFDCGPLVSAPRSLVIACADANFRLASLHWHAWGSRAATATGSAVVNDCTPNCAAGHFHTYRVAVSADTLRSCGRARYYARLTVDFRGTPPAGMKRRVVTPLGC